MILQANALAIPLSDASVNCVVTSQRNANGQFVKGFHAGPATEFKQGQHWRPRREHWDAGWLQREYVTNGRSAADIAVQQGITEAAVFHWMRRHGIPRRTMSEVRAAKHWGLSGKSNGMYGKKGQESVNWKGGCTPERQAVYSSEEWADAVKVVWRRDLARCRRCGAEGKHIHHIVSFSEVSIRCDPDNLVLLCVQCHRFVHSRRNTAQEFIRQVMISDSASERLADSLGG